MTANEIDRIIITKLAEVRSNAVAAIRAAMEAVRAIEPCAPNEIRESQAHRLEAVKNEILLEITRLAE